jgi:hypothetical protein
MLNGNVAYLGVKVRRAEDEKKRSWMDKRMEELMPELVGLVLVELLVCRLP